MTACLIGGNRHPWRSLLGTAFVPLLAAVLGRSAQAEQPQALSTQHVPNVAARLTPIGELPGSQRLNLAIGLPLRNQPELDSLLQQLYDPAGPNYRRYLTPEQFTARFGPTEKDYQAVMDFAKSNGLTVTFTHPNRLVLDVAGTVTDIQKACHLTMRVYRHPKEAREFYAPDVEPAVDLSVPILHISGLDNYSIPHPNLKPSPASTTANAAPNSGTGLGGTYRGADFRTAYVPGASLTGAGQTVGLLQFDGFYASDIATYTSQAGLPRSRWCQLTEALALLAAAIPKFAWTSKWSCPWRPGCRGSTSMKPPTALASGLTSSVAWPATPIASASLSAISSVARGAAAA